MAAAKGLKGIDNVMRNLNIKLAKMKIKSLAGLISAAILIRVDMDKVPPLIPVDTGNLRGSWFVTSSKGTSVRGGSFSGEDAGKMAAKHGQVVSTAAAKAQASPFPMVIIGFSAIYSVLVHEMVGDINWNRPGSGGHFFISSLNRNRALILRTIANSIRL